MDNQNPNMQPEQKPSNGMAIAALVCGILGIVGSFIPIVCYFTLILAIVGLVLGVKARKEQPGNGMATAGMVLGIIGVAFAVVGVICVICAVGVIGAAGAF